MKIVNSVKKLTINTFLIVFFILISSCAKDQTTVKDVIDNVITRFYNDLSKEELKNLNDEKIKGLLSEKEFEVLATQYWMFDVNVPVEVYIMQDKNQQVDPFWISKAEFTLTDMFVKNEHSTYKVWKKQFSKGRVNLGINGFDKHGPHYFVVVKPLNKNDDLILSNIFPANQYVAEMKVGAFIYHDWDELLLCEVPDELVGGKLLTTIRGRAREAHLINAFRETNYPSSDQPDQIMLTWSEDPTITQSVQWRTSVKNKIGVVQYWKNDNEKKIIEVNANADVIEDRLLQNDRYINHFTAELKNLEASTLYKYRVGNPESNIWSEENEFLTAPKNNEPFSFIYLGDTHKSSDFGQLINDAYNKYPEAAFYSIGGDLVSTGLYREHWDQLFNYSANVISNKPLMSTLGNHDSQEGLGSWMYQALFDLPKNGPQKLDPETTYSFTYSNTLFLMMDVTASITDQTAWLEEQLKNSKQTWKIAMLHFPPYSWEDDYPLIRSEWCSLFDKYHVDLVFSGHVHYYLRSKPMFNQKPVETPADGTIYIISISVGNREREMEPREFVDVRFSGDHLFSNIIIDEKKLYYKAINQDGIEKDSFSIVKN